MKILTESQLRDKGLSIPQVRVLQVLYRSRGPLTRAKISEWIGNKTQVVVGRAVGYSDPAKRQTFEQTIDGGYRPSLLTLEYVEEDELDIDGLIEVVVRLTPKGRAAFEALGHVELPPLRNTHEPALAEPAPE